MITPRKSRTHAVPIVAGVVVIEFPSRACQFFEQGRENQQRECCPVGKILSLAGSLNNEGMGFHVRGFVEAAQEQSHPEHLKFGRLTIYAIHGERLPYADYSSAAGKLHLGSVTVW